MGLPAKRLPWKYQSAADCPDGGSRSGTANYVSVKSTRMSEPDRHHYVPIFYLKQWAANDGRIVRFNRPHQRVEADWTVPKRTGYEPGLYRLDGYAAEQANAIEKHFMSPIVDDQAAPALRALLGGQLANLDPHLRQSWTRFVMSLVARNPQRVERVSRDAAKSLRASLLENPQEYDSVRTPDDPATLLEWVEQNVPALVDNHGKQMLPGLITHQPTGNAIIQMNWCVVRLPADAIDMLTCDRPVYMSHGVMDIRCIIALPLSPRHIFFATRRPLLFEEFTRKQFKFMTASLNGLLVEQAQRFVYGASDRHLRFVENRLRK